MLKPLGTLGYALRLNFPDVTSDELKQLPTKNSSVEKPPHLSMTLARCYVFL
jgi:hypothetical protein